MHLQRKKVVFAALLLLAVAAAALAGLTRLSRPEPTQMELSLTCTESERNGWLFFTEHGEAEPVFGFGGYLNGIAAEGVGPVAAERVMGEDEEREFLQFLCYNAGIEVFLDGDLLYTDFPDATRGEDSFLLDADPTGIGYDGLRIPLPEDCMGKTLRVVTYTDSYDGLRWPTLPTLVNRYSDAVMQTASVVWPMAAVTALLLLVLVLLVIFLLSARTDELQWKLLPLAAYFLLAALLVSLQSWLSAAAGLNVQGLLLWLSRLSIDALFCFLALELTGWRRWVLLSGAVVHVILSALWAFAGISLPTGMEGDAIGFALFLLSLLLLLTAKHPRLRRSAIAVCAAAGVLLGLYAVSRVVGNDWLYLLANPASAMLSGHDPRAFFMVLCGFTGLLCAAQTVGEFIRGALLRQRQTQALEARSRMVQANYEQTLEMLAQTAAFRHEWKNHVAVLDVLLQKGDRDGAAAYLTRLDGQLDRLTPHNYTANFTVNTILQRYATQADERDVRFSVSASLPEALGLDESDLCRLLFNLLDNALEAAVKTPPERPREIRCTLQIRQSYLAISCENTYDGTLSTDEHGQLLSTKDKQSEHGFGLVQMRAIAEKYGSTLSISCDGERFKVMTALKLR